MWLALKNLLFTLIVPGSVAGYLPVWIGGGLDAIPAFGLGPGLALPLLAVGAAIILWPVVDFGVAGQGTPLPLDPPRKLVIRGLYRYVRNPMYTGVLLMNAGWALMFASGAVALYGAAVWLIQFTLVVSYEEPKLAQLFGEEYTAYRATAGRWLPRL